MDFFQSHLDSTATEPLIFDLNSEMSEEYVAGSMHSPVAMRSVTERTAECTLPHGEAFTSRIMSTSVLKNQHLFVFW